MVRVSSKGQIALPKEYRESLGIKQGDYLRIHEVDDGALLLEKVQQSALDTMFADVRAEAKQQGITRADMDQLIKDIRSGRCPDADPDERQES